jgi:hypothetical protein
MTIEEEVESAVYAAMRKEFEDMNLGAFYENRQIADVVSHLEKQAVDDVLDRLQSLQETVHFIVANMVEEE